MWILLNEKWINSHFTPKYAISTNDLTLLEITESKLDTPPPVVTFTKNDKIINNISTYLTVKMFNL